MHNLFLVYFFKHLYEFRAYLQSINMLHLLMMGCRYSRNMKRCLTKYIEDKICISWFSFKRIYRAARSTKHKTQKYCWSWKVKQTKLFLCVTSLLAHQVLDNVSLLLNQMFSFTVFEPYFMLVVYSLYRELKGTAPPNPV